jgi:hypothetical protein
MSKLKSPQEKKKASLDHDRRNAYGENDKASRKLIPLRKQQSNQAERRTSSQPLARLKGKFDENEAVASELESRTQTVVQRRTGFRKKPDARLKDLLAYQRTGRWPETRR